VALLFTHDQVCTTGLQHAWVVSSSSLHATQSAAV
jgi:hypothetical protein